MQQQVEPTAPSAVAAAAGLAALLIAASAAAQTAAPPTNPQRARVQALLMSLPHAQPSELGNGGVPEIVDGKPAAPGRWPFTVALLDKGTPDNYNAQFCGGALIDNNHVLTAAHCVEGASASDMQVLVGTNSLAQGGRRIDVARVTIHPDFDTNPFLQSDVAVLRLGEAVNDITPVTYASSTTQDNNIAPDNARTTVVGWGQLTWLRPGPEELHQASLPRNTIAECNGLNFYNGRLTKLNVCAGDLQQPGKSACYGDSGGPLVARDDNGNTVQIGVVSGGPTVCGDVPGYFARVGSFAKWIDKQVTAP
jgi:trypsin